MSRKRSARLPALLLVLGAACSRAAPEPSPVTSSQAVSAAALDCRRDVSAKDCARANASLQQDAAAWAVPPAITSKTNEPEQSDEARTAIAVLMAAECQQQRHVLQVLKRRERGEGELLSDEERAQIPAQIENVQRYLGSSWG